MFALSGASFTLAVYLVAQLHEQGRKNKAVVMFELTAYT
jgi:hypothetical protein